MKNMTKTYGNYNIGPYFIELHMVVYLNGKRHLYIINLVRWNRESRMMKYRTSALSPKSCSHCQSSTSSSPPPSPPPSPSPKYFLFSQSSSSSSPFHPRSHLLKYSIINHLTKHGYENHSNCHELDLDCLEKKE